MDPGLAGGVEWRPACREPIYLANTRCQLALLGDLWASATDAGHAKASLTPSTSIEVKQARDLRKVPLVNQPGCG
jgi:hypothetical protein